MSSPRFNSAFFLYVVNILAFVNQRPWRIKAVIIAVFSIPAVVFLLLGAFFRGHTQRDTGIVLPSASALSALAMLSLLCAWASQDIARYFSAGTFRFFSDLSILNRWAAGEAKPWDGADWNGSWQRTTVTDDQWRTLRDGLRHEAEKWRNVVATRTNWNDMGAAAALSTAAHTAYYFGAIKQILVGLNR